MPLSYTKKPKKLWLVGMKNKILQIIGYFGVDYLLVLFFLVAMTLAFLKIAAWGFYISYAVFIIAFFAERIIRILHKK